MLRDVHSIPLASQRGDQCVQLKKKGSAATKGYNVSFFVLKKNKDVKLSVFLKANNVRCESFSLCHAQKAGDEDLCCSHHLLRSAVSL